MTIKTIDIVKQLQHILPKLTDEFTSSLAIASCVANVNNLEISPSKTNMKVGAYVTITGLKLSNPITSSVSVDGITTIKTQFKTDVTAGWTKVISVYNGSVLKGYEFVERVSDSEIKIKDAAATDLSGQLMIEEIAGYNKQYQITAVDASKFVVGYGNPTTKGFYVVDAKTEYAYKINGVGLASDIDKYIISTTEKLNNAKSPKTSIKPTLWVRMIQETTSQNQQTFDDSNNSTGHNQSTKILSVKQFDILLTYPMNSDVSGIKAVTFAEDLKVLLDKCLYGAKFDSNINTTQEYLLIPLSNNPVESDGAVYQHSFIYESCYEMQNDIEDGNDGYTPESFDLKLFNIQYKLEDDGFVETKKTDIVEI